MSFLLILAFLFFIGSQLGWNIELLFRRFFSRNNPQKRWVNPGFLMGPWLPLYGFGLCILYVLTFLEPHISVAGLGGKLILFAGMAAAMTAVELVTGLFFLSVMKTRLWDYSGERGNYKGLICPKFSFFWAVLSALYYFLVHPRILSALAWLSDNLTFSFFIGLFFGLFAVDVFYSFRLGTRLRRLAAEYHVVVRYEELQHHLAAERERLKEKRHFFLSFHSALPLAEHFKNRFEKK